MASKKWTAKVQRMRRAFDGWWERRGHDFAITPEPRNDVRERIAKHAFEAGWKARSDRAQRQALKVTRSAPPQESKP